MLIGKCKLDKQGRITLPKTFLDANNIKVNADVFLANVVGKSDAIKIVFTDYTWQETNCNEDE